MFYILALKGTPRNWYSRCRGSLYGSDVVAIERLLGHAHLYDSVLRAIICPELTIEIHSKFAVVTVRHAKQPERYRRIVFKRGMAIWCLRELVTAMREVAGIIVIEETRVKAERPCPDCNGQGGGDDQDGNWIGCKTCDETGLV
jgi:hypothetical protein